MADRADLHLGIGMDTTAFRKVAKALRSSAPELAKELRVGLRVAGEIVASDARSRAEEASKTIPPSIKVRVSGFTVAVVAGGDGVPLAGLMELGNKGAKNATTFKHPVFGKWRTSTPPQDMHPYLTPAAQAHDTEFEAAAIGVIDTVVGKFITGSE